jgi:hypothetical protein
MTREELLNEIRSTYEWAEKSSGPFLVYGIAVTRVVFYHSTLREVMVQPFDPPEFQDMVVEVLETKLDEAFGALLPEEFEQVFRLSEEFRSWEENRHIPSARRVR